MSSSEFASIAVGRPVRGRFTYRVPPALEGVLEPGRRVVVPFGTGSAVGFYLGPGEVPTRGAIKTIAATLDDGPVLAPDLLRFLEWVAHYYRHPLGDTLRSALPPGFGRPADPPPERKSTATFVSLARPDAPLLRGMGMRAVVEYLRACGRVPLEELAASIPGARDPLRRLAAQGLVRLEEEARPPDAPGPFASPRPTRLTDEQQAAIAAVGAAARAREFVAFLLQGVTASGKTEVYLHAIEQVRGLGRGALCLVPEIALTPQLVGRFRGRFGDDVAVLHSGLTERQRLDMWRRLRDGRARIAVGVRSAIFAPVSDLGIVVVDEEHDASFKQEERLRYQARDLAVVRAKFASGPVVLGSATPSLESLENARRGRYRHLRLLSRIDGRPMPEVSIVDLRRERRPPAEPEALPRAAEEEEEATPLLSAALADALSEVLAAKRQAMLLLNRRGHSTFHLCATCGLVLRCPRCSVALTYHLARRSLLCHTCGHATALPQACAECRGAIVHFGTGTEKVAEEVARRFPQARVERLDRDAAAPSGAIDRVLTRFAAQEIDVLVGTQLLAKGHDFPGVTLVGVVLADTALHLPDFRAAERTFQLLTQVAGRAGRGEAPGRVVIQSYNPKNDAVARVVGHDYEGFAEEELKRRRALYFPPFARLAAVRVEGPDPMRTMHGARQLADACAVAVRASGGSLQLVGPAPAPIARVRGRARWQMLLKGPTTQALAPALEAVEAAMRRIPSGVRAFVDVDPVDLL